MAEITYQALTDAMRAELSAAMANGPVTPATLRVRLVAAIDRLYAERFAEAIIVERDKDDANRVNVLLPAAMARIMGFFDEPRREVLCEYPQFGKVTK